MRQHAFLSNPAGTHRIFTPEVAAALLALTGISAAAGELFAQSWNAAGQPGVFATIWKWLPLILFGTLGVHIRDGSILITGQLGGFSLNILVSVIVMAAG